MFEALVGAGLCDLRKTCIRLQTAALVDRETVQCYREQHWTTPQYCWAAEEALRGTKSAMDQAERSYCEHLAGVHATSFFVYSSILRQPLLNGCTETVQQRIAELFFRSMAAQSAWVKAERDKNHEAIDGSIRS
jgi:hypothetical protein